MTNKVRICVYFVFAVCCQEAPAIRICITIGGRNYMVLPSLFEDQGSEQYQQRDLFATDFSVDLGVGFVCDTFDSVTYLSIVQEHCLRFVQGGQQIVCVLSGLFFIPMATARL
jgi:hypothetical protein